MLNTILRYGALAGLIVGLPMVVLTALMKDSPPSPTVGMAIGYTTMLIALSMVFIGIKRHRDGALGGVIGFLPAFAMGLGISLVAAIFYAAAWEITMGLTGLDFGAAYAEGMIAEAAAKGLQGAALDAAVADARAFQATYANPFYRFAISTTEILPVGLAASLVSAGLLCNRRFLPARVSSGQ